MGRNPKKTASDFEQLILKEGWEIVERDKEKKVLAEGIEYPLVHPVVIWNKIYRVGQSPEERYRAMVKVHDYYWPHYVETWNYWEEERYYAHCENWSFISMAGGASTAKSHTMAKILLQFYWSDPTKNAAIVTSTTLSALQKRVMGYVVNLLHEIKIPFQYHYTKSPSPQILHNPKDEIHSISALAAGMGTDEQAIKNAIGRHPKGRLMVALDEATDLAPVVMKSVANLEAGEDGKLQVWGIGNSNNKSDLHAALSTPRDGWESVSWQHSIKWLTTQNNGICLYFSPYRSPAIHETDPEKKAKLAKFFITAEQIEERKKTWGENSIEYARFVLGWWLDSFGGDSTFTSKPFLEIFKTKRLSLWSGLHPLRMTGGFDPAFSTGGDKAILRLGIMGHTAGGQVVYDFRDSHLQFRLRMAAVHQDPIDIQLADQIIDLLIAHNCLLEDVAFDVTGQGRAFPELVRQRAAAKRGIHWNSAIKVYNSRSSNKKNNQPEVVVKTPTELWDNLKEFIQTNQICGLDDISIYQLTTRLLVFNEKTKKRELEHKQDYRNRMSAINPGQGTSPDEADAASLALFAAIYRHGLHLEQVKPIEGPRDIFSEKWDIMKRAEMQEQKKVQLVMPKASYSSEMKPRKARVW